MGGAPLLRYFLDAYFSKGFGGAFHAFLQIVFISRSPLYIGAFFKRLEDKLREAEKGEKGMYGEIIDGKSMKAMFLLSLFTKSFITFL